MVLGYPVVMELREDLMNIINRSNIHTTDNFESHQKICYTKETIYKMLEQEFNKLNNIFHDAINYY